MELVAALGGRLGALWPRSGDGDGRDSAKLETAELLIKTSVHYG